MLRKVVVYYTRKHENVKNEFLVMIWNCFIFRNKTSNLQGTNKISKIHISSKMINQKTCHVLGEL